MSRLLTISENHQRFRSGERGAKKGKKKKKKPILSVPPYKKLAISNKTTQFLKRVKHLKFVS
jgi:hypothetical protein